MKVAIVHDFLTQMGGAEKVVEVLHEMFPEAPIYTSTYDAAAMPAHYRDWDIRTSFLQKLVLKKHTHRLALLLYPTAFESFDLSEYDVVISSSSAFAKGVVTQPDTTHVCYTHAPMRYAWTMRSYVKNERMAKPFRSLLTPGLHYLRTWDSVASNRVDQYVANSSAVAKRIYKFYRRVCEVIYPPVETGKFAIAPANEVGDYGIVVSRFVPYKRIDLAVQAFTKLNKPLKVVGTGRQLKALQAMAGPSIEFLGHVSDEDLPGLMARAQMFLMPGEEDFGIAAVESLACGRPVVAFAAGGSLDVQVDGKTGVLFEEQTVDGLCEAVRRAEQIEWQPEEIRRYAQERFDTQVFRERMAHVVQAAATAKTELSAIGNRRNPWRNGRRASDIGVMSFATADVPSVPEQGAVPVADKAPHYDGANGVLTEAVPFQWADAGQFVARTVDGETREPELAGAANGHSNGYANGHNNGYANGHNGLNGHH